MKLPLLLFLAAVQSTTLGFINITDVHNQQPAEGRPCVSPGSQNYAIDDFPTKFLHCNPSTRRYIVASCPTLKGKPLLFDERNQECTAKFSSVRRTPGVARSSHFGEPCSQNTDCMGSMFCPAGTCLCLPGFIDIRQNCYPIINPGQPNCIDTRQCAAVWPGAFCQNNVCHCPNDRQPLDTKDGVVCHRVGFCPLPDDVTGTPSALPEGKCDGANPEQYCGGMPDLYDCVPHTTEPEKICCPNRALTCIQSKTDSLTSVVGSQSRYWYNSITGNCEQFLFDPTSAVATANNFLTIEQCQSYCSVACKRGSPQYIGHKAKECQSTAQCSSTVGKYQCVAAGSKRLCCPSIPTFLCTASGGRGYGSTSPDPGVGALSEMRWYYDSALKTCQNFLYKGHGGNFNNFLSQHDCTNFCIQNVCEQGEPLKDLNGNVQQCSGGRGCPSSYDCHRNVCCPSKQTVCSQPKLVGTCTSAVTKFWYDTVTRDCKAFTFTGCNGNDNNFDTYIQCVTFCRDSIRKPSCPQGEADKDSSGKYYLCSMAGGVHQCRPNFECLFDGSIHGCCPKKPYTCSLNKAAGNVCGAPTVRWYFDPTSKICKTFSYMGCDGNSNNFDTKERCERYCGVGGCPYGGKPFQDDSMSIRVCNEISATCPSNYECTTVAVSNAAVRYCCPTRASICSQPPNRGTQCGNPTERYYFYPLAKQCKRFTFYGCSGNDNNFPTLGACMNFCGSSACEPGEGIIMDPVSQSPVKCNANMPNSCPTGYVCRTDPLTSSTVCCGASDMGVCPQGELAYVDPLTQQVRECQPGATLSCPSHYLCRPNPSRNRYFCCRVAQSAMCPAGKSVYVDVLTSQPQTCIIGPFNPCPVDYSCYSTTNQREGYCCTVQTICPNNEEFYVDPNTMAARSCSLYSVGYQQCPAGFTCKSNRAGSNTGFCCRTAGGQGYCPSGNPLLEATGARRCTLGALGTCPAGYACMQSPSDPNLHYCCSSGGAGAADGCPPGMTVYIVQGFPQTCQPGIQSCPSGYTCQYSSTHGRYQCCGAGSAQPGGVCSNGSPFMDGQVPRTCTPAMVNNCPAGYSCQSSSINPNVYYCCSTLGPGSGSSMGCPPGTFVYMLQGVPQDCQPGQASCPAGYTCQYSSERSRYQCCGVSTTGPPNVCPVNQAAYIDPTTGQALTCVPGTTCPAGFTCTTTTSGVSYCCSAVGGGGPGISPHRCPYPGHQPYYPAGSIAPLSCQPGVLNTCPRGYLCHNAGSGFICCGKPQQPGQGWQARCPFPNQKAYIQPGTNSPRKCQPSNRQSCPINYDCLNGGDGFICCESNRGGTTQVCPAGTRPYTQPVTHSPMRCIGNVCPAGFRCTFSSAAKGYFCCSTAPATGGETACPSNLQAYLTPYSSDLLTCGLGLMAKGCPTGYICIYSNLAKTYICCGRKFIIGVSGCPTGRPYLYPNTNKPLKCQPGMTACPRGYQCLYSAANQSYQCCSVAKAAAQMNKTILEE